VLRDRVDAFAALAGFSLEPDTDIDIVGDDPVLRSPFRLGEGVATVLGLLGQEATSIGALRGLPAQRLRVDVRHAAACLQSFLLLQIDGGIVPLLGLRAGAALTGIFACRNGRRIHLHGSFDDPAAVLAVLGGGSALEVAAVAEATAPWDAFELEDALASAGLCGAVCRRPQEWAQHPQGVALASRPLVEVTRIGDGPPVPFGPAERPLAGVRVLDLTRVLAGPTVARSLAEHGADVLHVAAPHLPTVPLFEIDTGHGKRQTYLDLRDPAAADRLHRLVAEADVFSQGFQSGSLARRGFGPEELAAIRPGIVYVSENAYGHVGPWQDRPGWEQLAQAATGITVQQGGSEPVIAPAAMNDYTTGYLGALGAMIALRRRASEGGSWLVQTSLARTAMWFQSLGVDLDPSAATEIGDVGSLIAEADTGYGRLGYLRPALEMSVTPPAWAVPVRPLGSDPPEWLDA
jgi:hypothetical protein